MMKRRKKVVTIFMALLWASVLQSLEPTRMSHKFLVCLNKQRNKRSEDIRDRRKGITQVKLRRRRLLRQKILFSSKCCHAPSMYSIGIQLQLTRAPRIKRLTDDKKKDTRKSIRTTPFTLYFSQMKKKWEKLAFLKK